jgi:uncharacterized membrane protein YedE/YeeE
MRVRAVAVCFGTVFGFLLAWSGLASPDAIRRMLLLEDPYLFEMFATAVAVGFVGVRVVRRVRTRALVTGEVLAWSATPPQRRHVVGAAIFGTGWAIADACPGPIAAQLGGGVVWSLCTAAGVLVGIELYLRRSERRARVRAPEGAAATSTA